MTGLSVLAWPTAYFHNYKRLLSELGVQSEEVRLPFTVRHVEKDVIFAQNDRSSGGWTYFAEDLSRWRQMVNMIRIVDKFLKSPEQKL